jgi:hypothetical protein
LGPSRQRLGLAWVIAPLVTGVVLMGVGAFVLLRPHPPGAPYVRATTMDAVAGSTGSTQGVHVVVAGTPIVVRSRGTEGLQAASATGDACYPVLTYRGDVYVDVTATPPPCPSASGPSPPATGT